MSFHKIAIILYCFDLYLILATSLAVLHVGIDERSSGLSISAISNDKSMLLNVEPSEEIR